MSIQGFRSALEAVLYTSISSANLTIFGIFCHPFLFWPIKINNYLYHFLAILLASQISLGIAYVSLTNFGTVQALARTALVITAFYAGTFGSIVICRLVFHRLRAFPGPLGAKISRFYTLNKGSKNVQFV